MPLNRCEDEGRPGWRWGDAGKCYVYTAGDEDSEKEARRKAMAQAAAMGEFPGTGEGRAEPRGPVEYREASVSAVDGKQRLIDLLVLPYEQEAVVEFRGEMWHEVFTRGAFDGIEDHAGRVAVRRGHLGDKIVGRMVQMASTEDALLGRARIVPTPLGDETLILAEEDCLSPSVGFTVRGRDQLLDRRSMLRRINKGFADHVALIERPAYTGARVLAVREDAPAPAVPTTPLSTPTLDEYLRDPLLSWASRRVSGQL